MDKSVILHLSLSVVFILEKKIDLSFGFVLFAFFPDYEKESQQREKNDISSYLPVL